MDVKARVSKLKIDIPAMYLALKKKETPWSAKIFAIITVAYALSPIDLIPDFIPVLGYLDDLVLLPVLIMITVRLMPADILNECRAEAKDLWANECPKKWYYSIPMILLWIAISFLILKALWPVIYRKIL